MRKWMLTGNGDRDGWKVKVKVMVNGASASGQSQVKVNMKGAQPPGVFLK